MLFYRGATLSFDGEEMIITLSIKGEDGHRPGEG